MNPGEKQRYSSYRQIGKIGPKSSRIVKVKSDLDR